MIPKFFLKLLFFRYLFDIILNIFCYFFFILPTSCTRCSNLVNANFSLYLHWLWVRRSFISSIFRLFSCLEILTCDILMQIQEKKCSILRQFSGTYNVNMWNENFFLSVGFFSTCFSQCRKVLKCSCFRRQVRSALGCFKSRICRFSWSSMSKKIYVKNHENFRLTNIYIFFGKILPWGINFHSCIFDHPPAFNYSGFRALLVTCSVHVTAQNFKKCSVKTVGLFFSNSVIQNYP